MSGLMLCVLCAVLLPDMRGTVGVPVHALTPRWSTWGVGFPSPGIPGSPGKSSLALPEIILQRTPSQGDGRVPFDPTAAVLLELSAAGAANLVSTAVGFGIEYTDWPLIGRWNRLVGATGYVLSSALITGTAAWATGKLLGQEGEWRKAVAGAAAGAAIPAVMSLFSLVSEPVYAGITIGVTLVVPPVGAVLGYNAR